MKFDTGASDTIITTGALGLDGIQADTLLRSIQNGKVKADQFISASGDSFIGYPCFCDDLRIGDVRVGRFYYHVVFNDMPKALLGDDFISCCTFSHGFKGDIVVTAFQAVEYEKQCFSGVRGINVFEVLCGQKFE